MFCPRSAVWRSRMRMECTSSSKAWNRAGPFVSACRSSRRKTPTTASWRTSAAALRITISISGMRFWACARGEFLSVSRHLLAERPLLHRTGTEAKADPFSEERQCLPGGRRCGRTAGGCRPAESMHHPQTTQLLDLDPGTQVLQKGTGTNEPVAFLRHRANRILPQFRFQTSFPDPQALRAKL